MSIRDGLLEPRGLLAHKPDDVIRGVHGDADGTRVVDLQDLGADGVVAAFLASP